MKDKVILITGATSGIGKATAIKIAALGPKVIITARDATKGKLVLEEIKTLSRNNNVHLLMIDLSNQDSIRKAVIEFKQVYKRLDVLINNAGTSLFTRQVTDEGYEKNFATNYLGPFLLTNLLLDTLKSSAPSRIVNVSSSAQSKPNIDDLMSVKEFNALKVYAQSKTALIFFTYELANRLEGSGVTVNCLHPGVVRTELARDAKGIIKALFKIALLFFITPEKGAETSVYLATSDDVAKTSGKYFVKNKPAQSATYTYDKDLGKQLWTEGVKLTHLN